MRGLSLPSGVSGGLSVRHSILLLLLALPCFSLFPSVYAQPYDVDAKTQVRALRFEFVNGQTFDTEQLEEQMALKAPSNKLPFFPQI